MNPEKFVIPGDAYPYLVAQRGALDDMRDEPELWAAKYLEVLQSEMRSIEPYLPPACDAVLDIGGGMGGIDVLLNEHYNGCHVTILDGIADPPRADKHDVTFSNKEVARNFLSSNGVESFDFIDANAPAPAASRFYDLIVSFKSWCFHLPPERYLALVLSCVIPKQTVLIIDVRAKNDRYYDVLCEHFGKMACIFSGPKFDTLWMQAR